MGMTLNEAIKHGTEQLEIFGGEHKEFIEVALDTMRKYQKIEQILKDIPYGGDATVRRIQEVIENGID